jgi:hypothetical protein
MENPEKPSNNNVKIICKAVLAAICIIGAIVQPSISVPLIIVAIIISGF